MYGLTWLSDFLTSVLRSPGCRWCLGRHKLQTTKHWCVLLMARNRWDFMVSCHATFSDYYFKLNINDMWRHIVKTGMFSQSLHGLTCHPSGLSEQFTISLLELSFSSVSHSVAGHVDVRSNITHTGRSEEYSVHKSVFIILPNSWHRLLLYSNTCPSFVCAVHLVPIPPLCHHTFTISSFFLALTPFIIVPSVAACGWAQRFLQLAFRSFGTKDWHIYSLTQKGAWHPDVLVALLKWCAEASGLTTSSWLY